MSFGLLNITMLVTCHFNSNSTEAGVIYEAGYVESVWSTYSPGDLRLDLKQTAIVFKHCFYQFPFIGDHHIQNLKKSIQWNIFF